jgi:hypothetical protein
MNKTTGNVTRIIYYKLDDKNVKRYFIDHILLGSEYDLIKYFIGKEGMSSSKSHARVKKIKEYVEPKR